MAKIHNTAVAWDAMKKYKNFITSAEIEMFETFLTDDVDIQMKHFDAEKKALDYFSRHQMGDDQSNFTILIQLKLEKQKRAC